MRGLLLLLAFIAFSFSQRPFQTLEGAVGYIVVERGGKVENFVVVEGKDGSVRAVKVDKNPSTFMKKSNESERGSR